MRPVGGPHLREPPGARFDLADAILQSVNELLPRDQLHGNVISELRGDKRVYDQKQVQSASGTSWAVMAFRRV